MSSGSNAAPLCQCNVPCMQKVSRTTSNPDRPFWKCAGNPGCNFFAWADQVRAQQPGVVPSPSPPSYGQRQSHSAAPPGPQSPAARGQDVGLGSAFQTPPRTAPPSGVHSASVHGQSEEGPPCRCNPPEPTRKLVSRTIANPHRPFWKCQKCGFFKWADEVLPSPHPAQSVPSPPPALSQPTAANLSQTTAAAPVGVQSHAAASSVGGIVGAPPLSQRTPPRPPSVAQPASVSTSLHQGSPRVYAEPPGDAGPSCRCAGGMPSVKRMSRTDRNPNRWFWSCSRAACNYFQWADELPDCALPLLSLQQQPQQQQQQPPPTTPQRDRTNTGAASQTFPSPLAVPPSPPNIAGPSPSQTQLQRGRPSLVSHASGRQSVSLDCSLCVAEHKEDEAELLRWQNFVCDQNTLQLLQRLFDTTTEDQLGVGRDASSNILPYDTLKVEVAWQLRNDQKFTAYAKKRDEIAAEVAARGSPVQPPVRRDHQEAVNALLASSSHLEPLKEEASEMLLVHGTKPESVYPICFEGLNAKLAQMGAFGKGIYMADNAAKSDQYARPSGGFKGKEKDHFDPLHLLHRRLFSGFRGVKHPPGDVCFALVCRSSLGLWAVTKATVHEPRGQMVFVDPRKCERLKGGKHSLIAEPGQDSVLRRYREFIHFDSDAVYNEFLVCFSRQQKRCHCGRLAEERRVVKEGLDKHRPFLFCSQCGFKLMMPRCE
mmetsp:Transcript_51204/g.100567  ORF Transcript_51204/g.100567 Transcript_51204/m.100567 type:complete len:710 (-) Transcript_51204:82-2211(-)